MCENCLLDKLAKAPFGKGQRAESLLDAVHTNMCRPINVKTHRGMSYFIIFIGDFF